MNKFKQVLEIVLLIVVIIFCVLVTLNLGGIL